MISLINDDGNMPMTDAYYANDKANLQCTEDAGTPNAKMSLKKSKASPKRISVPQYLYSCVKEAVVLARLVAKASVGDDGISS
jgi:hypothetical protein